MYRLTTGQVLTIASVQLMSVTAEEGLSQMLNLPAAVSQYNTILD